MTFAFSCRGSIIELIKGKAAWIPKSIGLCRRPLRSAKQSLPGDHVAGCSSW